MSHIKNEDLSNKARHAISLVVNAKRYVAAISGPNSNQYLDNLDDLIMHIKTQDMKIQRLELARREGR